MAMQTVHFIHFEKLIFDSYIYTRSMEQDSKKLTSRDVFTDHPIVTYTNRVQHEMQRITGLLSSNHVSHAEKARAIRVLIDNLPPTAKEDLREEYVTLVNYSKNELLGSEVDPYKIYGTVSNWIYTNILQDAFRAIPLYRGEGMLGSSTKRYSDKEPKQHKSSGLGVS